MNDKLHSSCTGSITKQAAVVPCSGAMDGITCSWRWLLRSVVRELDTACNSCSASQPISGKAGKVALSYKSSNPIETLAPPKGSPRLSH